MSSAPVPSALTGFTRLGSSVYLCNPLPRTNSLSKPTSITPLTIPDPDLIILSSWLDALPRHIAKYTTSYQHLYPHSRLLLITTNLSDVILPSFTRSNQSRRDPILSIVLELPPDAKILLHTFSNGGSLTAVGIAKDYLRRRGVPLPVRAQVIDSAPGDGGFSASIVALSFSLPKGNVVGYYLALALVYVFVGGLWLLDRGLGWPNPITVLRRELNDTRIWGEGGRRLYVAGEGDQLVWLRDVLEHARQAEKMGWRVQREVFEGSGHVGHMVADKGRYWGAVKKVWEEE